MQQETIVHFFETFSASCERRGCCGTLASPSPDHRCVRLGNEFGTWKKRKIPGRAFNSWEEKVFTRGLRNRRIRRRTSAVRKWPNPLSVLEKAEEKDQAVKPGGKNDGPTGRWKPASSGRRSSLTGTGGMPGTGVIDFVIYPRVHHPVRWALSAELTRSRKSRPEIPGEKSSSTPFGPLQSPFTVRENLNFNPGGRAASTGRARPKLLSPHSLNCLSLPVSLIRLPPSSCLPQPLTQHLRSCNWARAQKNSALPQFET